MTHLSDKIKKWALSNYGLILRENEVEEKAKRICIAHGLTEKGYLQALDNMDKAIVNDTINAITVQESYFFRDAPLFLYLKTVLFPNLIKNKIKENNNQIAIWSAGCANGEEIYSIAIYLDQLLPRNIAWNLSLIGTDVNEFALKKGKEGLYSQGSMRATDKQIIHNYFETQSSTYMLKEKIRNMVVFKYENLCHIEKKEKKFDLIFCRNVFIYLDKEQITLILQHFYDVLTDYGMLFLGPSDLVMYLSHQFVMEKINNLYFFKKKIQNQFCAVTNSIRIDSKPALQMSKHSPNISYLETLSERSNQLKQINIELKEQHYEAALKKIDSYLSSFKETALVYRYKGEALIGLGDMDTALFYLKQSIKLDPLDAYCYFWKGILEVDMKNNETAIESLKKALYLKPNFLEASYNLGLLYIRNNQKIDGIKLLNQALKLAQEHPDSLTTVGTKEVYRQLVDAVNASILYYQGQNNE